MTETLERAITIHQPWAWAVAAGHKPVENRTWRPPLEAVGKLIGIHAGLREAGHMDYISCIRALGPVAAAQMPTDRRRAALIGVARLVGVVDKRGGMFGRMVGASIFSPFVTPAEIALADRIRPWWRGPWGWLLEEAVLLPEPIPMRGQQGLWRLPTHPNPVLPGELRSSAAWALEQWRKARETR